MLIFTMNINAKVDTKKKTELQVNYAIYGTVR